MEWLLQPESLIALVTLTVLELVLGIDNIVFLSILTSRLPTEKRPRARIVGLALAMLMRIALLFSIAWITRLTAPWFTVLGQEISGRDLILLLGGLFLLAKSTHEIHIRLEGSDDRPKAKRVVASFTGVIIQIILMDAIFSLDSVITAVGMTNELPIMVTAVVLAVAFMMLFAGSVSDFVERHPTVKMLALSFLLLIGVSLIAEGLDQHIPKGYIYFSMAFSVLVEMLNLKIGGRGKPVKLHEAEP